MSNDDFPSYFAKGKPQEEATNEYKKLKEAFFENKTDENLKKLIEFFNEKYRDLPKEIDEDLLELIKALNPEMQEKSLLAVDYEKMARGNFVEYLEYWKDSPLEEKQSLREKFQRNISIDFGGISKIVEEINKPIKEAIERERKMRETISNIIGTKLTTVEPEKQRIKLKPTDLVLRPRREYLDPDEIKMEKIEEGLSDIIAKLELMDDKIDFIKIAVQSGLISNREADEKLFEALEKDEGILEPHREQLYEILLERSMIRAAAGLEMEDGYLKRLWEKAKEFEQLASLIKMFIAIVPEIAERLF